MLGKREGKMQDSENSWSISKCCLIIHLHEILTSACYKIIFACIHSTLHVYNGRYYNLASVTCWMSHHSLVPPLTTLSVNRKPTLEGASCKTQTLHTLLTVVKISAKEPQSIMHNQSRLRKLDGFQDQRQQITYLWTSGCELYLSFVLWISYWF